MKIIKRNVKMNRKVEKLTFHVYNRDNSIEMLKAKNDIQNYFNITPSIVIHGYNVFIR